jgi:hypothetical protein
VESPSRNKKNAFAKNKIAFAFWTAAEISFMWELHPKILNVSEYELLEGMKQSKCHSLYNKWKATVYFTFFILLRRKVKKCVAAIFFFFYICRKIALSKDRT